MEEIEDQGEIDSARGPVFQSTNSTSFGQGARGRVMSEREDWIVLRGKWILMKLLLRESYNYSPRRVLIECSAGAAAMVCYDVQHFALSAGRDRPLRADPSPGRTETPIPAAHPSRKSWPQEGQQIS
jgi:hypothetical protein